MRVDPKRTTLEDLKKQQALEEKIQRLTKNAAIAISFLIIYFLFIKLLFL